MDASARRAAGILRGMRLAAARRASPTATEAEAPASRSVRVQASEASLNRGERPVGEPAALGIGGYEGAHSRPVSAGRLEKVAPPRPCAEHRTESRIPDECACGHCGWLWAVRPIRSGTNVPSFAFRSCYAGPL